MQTTLTNCKVVVIYKKESKASANLWRMQKFRPKATKQMFFASVSLTTILHKNVNTFCVFALFANQMVGVVQIFVVVKQRFIFRLKCVVRKGKTQRFIAKGVCQPKLL